MKSYSKDILGAIGNTPIVKLNTVTSEVESQIFVKCEFCNPGGSIKERIGAFILEKAIEDGKLKPGGTIIEGTSGNTGVGLAMYAAVNGFKTIFVLADKQSKEKVDNLRAFGAKVIICPTNVEPTDPRSYYSVSKRLSETIPNSYYVNQYDNEWNLQTHIETTGPEIYEQTGGEFDVFMAGVGTGGTISGCGTYLKSKKPSIKIVGVDVEGSILAHYHKTGEMIEAKPYVLEGLGEDFLPGNVKFDIIDDWVVVGDKESFIMTRRLLTQEGIYTGGSGGAAIVGAIKYAKTLKTPKKILVILPDSGNRYTSKIFNDDWMRDNGYLDSSFNVSIKELQKFLSNREVTTIQDTNTVEEAIGLMKKECISQLPVLSGPKQVLGVVTEKDLLRPVFENKLSLTDSVSLACQNKFVLVDENQLLSKVANSLVKKEVVLVTREDCLINILTHSDVLSFMAQNRN